MSSPRCVHDIQSTSPSSMNSLFINHSPGCAWLIDFKSKCVHLSILYFQSSVSKFQSSEQIFKICHSTINSSGDLFSSENVWCLTNCVSLFLDGVLPIYEELSLQLEAVLMRKLKIYQVGNPTISTMICLRKWICNRILNHPYSKLNLLCFKPYSAFYEKKHSTALILLPTINLSILFCSYMISLFNLIL